MVPVFVQSAAGDADVLKLEVAGTSNVLDLKRHIAKSRWEVPRIFQTLSLLSNVVEDSDTIAGLCNVYGAQSSLSLTMIVSMGSVCGQLRSSDQSRKLDALARLAKLGVHGGAAAAAAVSGCIADPDATVRQVAVKA
ncbi:unnamed protein product, partial [Prorocentrum cordatum]